MHVDGVLKHTDKRKTKQDVTYTYDMAVLNNYMLNPF
jgi:hypothetical protein